MEDDSEVNKADALIGKIFAGLLSAFLGAWAFSSISFWANNAMSLYEDCLWALIGACVGLFVGWRIGGKR